jgi:hypothetical protein
MPRRLCAFEDWESPFEDHVIHLGAKTLGRASPETGSPPEELNTKLKFKIIKNDNISELKNAFNK